MSRKRGQSSVAEAAAAGATPPPQAASGATPQQPAAGATPRSPAAYTESSLQSKRVPKGGMDAIKTASEGKRKKPDLRVRVDEKPSPRSQSSTQEAAETKKAIAAVEAYQADEALARKLAMEEKLALRRPQNPATGSSPQTPKASPDTRQDTSPEATAPQPLSSQSVSAEDELAPSAASFPQKRRGKDDEEEVRTESSSSPSQGPSDKMGMALGIGLMVIGIALMALAGPAGLLIGAGMMAYGGYKISQSISSSQGSQQTETRTQKTTRLVDSEVRGKVKQIEQDGVSAQQQPTVSRKLTHQIPEEKLRVEDHLLRIYSAIDLSKQHPEAKKLYEQKISQAKESVRKNYKIPGDVEIRFAEPTIETKNRTEAEKIAADLAANLANKYPAYAAAAAPLAPRDSNPRGVDTAAVAPPEVEASQGVEAAPKPGLFSRIFGSKPKAKPEPLSSAPPAVAVKDEPIIMSAINPMFVPSAPRPSVGGGSASQKTLDLLAEASGAAAGLAPSAPPRGSDPSVAAAAQAVASSSADAEVVTVNPLPEAEKTPPLPRGVGRRDLLAAPASASASPEVVTVNPLPEAGNKARIERVAGQRRDLMAALGTPEGGVPVQDPPVPPATPNAATASQRGQGR